MTQHNVYTLSSEDATPITPLGTHSGMDITLQNVNNVGYIYVGGENLTAENYGYRIHPHHAVSFELAGQDFLYAIAQNDDAKLAVIRIDLESQNG
jgi:hypothetical protein